MSLGTAMGVCASTSEHIHLPFMKLPSGNTIFSAPCADHTGKCGARRGNPSPYV